ncbi:SGNH/GDSL hydrolase family protein [uncultured Roseobacter sp.]|uniref:SGNH/GDSL hydrolase family protein n=1 Tax=uncultured Roseobacter sp. TaxID=114847 RepID=UPI0026018988|nr:SGNH/GDSL hydrolase family protein [uncultured Roseobacter sp.]
MIRFLISVCVTFALLAGCTEQVSNDQPARILTMGDSMLAWHDGSDNSVSDVIEQILNEPVIDRSVPGARIFYRLPITGALGMNISKQYVPADWDWVILNGGGNDLWMSCACAFCDRRINRMISADGSTGAIPDIIDRAQTAGARVIWVGYLRSPGVRSGFEHCREEGDEIEARLARRAATDENFWFVSMKDLVPFGDRSYHDDDMVHPSRKGSRAIALRVAGVIRNASPDPAY